MQRVEPSELEEGDRFSQERSSEKFEVVGFAQISGYPAVIGENVETGQRHRFGGMPAYSPTLFKLEDA